MEISGEQFWAIFGWTLFAGLSTGIGGAIAFFTRLENSSGRFLSASLGFSAGVMIYISLVELMPLARHDLSQMYSPSVVGGLCAVTAFAAGLGITFLIDRLIPDVENPHHVRSEKEIVQALHATPTERARQGRAGLLFMLAIGVHNFPEGLATFAGGLSGMDVGIPIAIAVALHNIPEGIAIAVPILYATGSREKAFFYSLLSGLAEPAGALLGFWFLMPFLTPALLAMLFALVAGVMIYISFDELLPMAEIYGAHHIALAGILTGMLFMGYGLEFL
ncbi:MAG: zinc transporter ZupT [Planctomycetia bacterium]|nr:zinc transporter ZupT [Planctomycetia bacterium]